MYHVADFLIRIKNAAKARRHLVSMPYSNISFAIGKVLVKEGFLANVKEEIVEGKRQIAAELRYVRRKAVVNDVEVVSKPSLRVYSDKHTLSQIRSKAMISILTTSQGIMTGKNAEKKGVGGEVLFYIW